MDYPVYIDGAKQGRLTVTEEGLRTRFEVSCAEMSGIIRIYVFGCGEGTALGVLCPRDGGMYLNKSFSKNELRRFPKKIEYAANTKLRLESADTCITTEWVMSTKGCLVSENKGQTLVAIPAVPERVKNKGEIREIEGRFYMIFRKK